MREAKKTIAWAADALRSEPRHVLIASTGVIGDFMPMELLSEEIPDAVETLLRTDEGRIALSFHKAAEAIMTTDTTVKIAHATIKIGGKEVRIWGCCKGAGHDPSRDDT